VQNEIKERTPQELYNYENLRYEQDPKHRMKVWQLEEKRSTDICTPDFPDAALSAAL
jgi:hypothetical protein